MLAVFVKVPTM